jgi:hypothetical protein
MIRGSYYNWRIMNTFAKVCAGSKLLTVKARRGLYSLLLFPFTL